MYTHSKRHQLDPPFFPSNAACNMENAFCILRGLVDGLVDPPNLKLPLRSDVTGGGGGVGGELMLDALGEDARSRDGVSQRPSSEGVIGREAILKAGIGIGVGVGNCACALDWPGFSGGGAGGSRSFSISDSRASSKLEIAFLMPSAPSASVPYGSLPVDVMFFSSETFSDSSRSTANTRAIRPTARILFLITALRSRRSS